MILREMEEGGENENGGEKVSKAKKAENIRPNYFLSIRIRNEEVIHSLVEIQNALVR